ncbi:hypothetical protein AB9K26_00595 [Psychroserpens sp. XS_ASV72]|uniref:hypothetical protein n=1 Tax=Psychroserpens sp. XS_ASV72 TaxID=3241293 RepID=UPI003518D2B3
MTKSQNNNILTKLHFLFLGIGILNWISKVTVEFSLNYKLAYVVTVLIFISGFVLFLWNLRPFNRIGIYYGYYFITPILTLIFWLFGGILLALISPVFLYPIYPNKILSEHQNFTVYENFQGFMGPCCPLEITEKHFWIIEQKLTNINLYDDTYIHSINYDKKNDSQLIIIFDKYESRADNVVPTDTIIKLN